MNLTIILKSIDYIEDNLKNDITAKELSEMVGFWREDGCSGIGIWI